MKVVAYLIFFLVYLIIVCKNVEARDCSPTDFSNPCVHFNARAGWIAAKQRETSLINNALKSGNGYKSKIWKGAKNIGMTPSIKSIVPTCTDETIRYLEIYSASNQNKSNNDVTSWIEELIFYFDIDVITMETQSNFNDIGMVRKYVYEGFNDITFKNWVESPSWGEFWHLNIKPKYHPSCQYDLQTFLRDVPLGNSKIVKANTKSNAKAAKKLSWPIRKGKFLAGFGHTDRGFHDGIDISAKQIEPIYAAQAGEVMQTSEFVDHLRQTVFIKGDRGIYTLYSNLKSIYVKKGEKVRIGQKIADCEVYFHFEVRTKDRLGRYVAVDPVPLLDKTSNIKPRFRVNNNMDHILNSKK